MNKKLIPDIAYEVDGDTVTIEQGWSEPVSVVLHKIHVKHLLNEMGLSVDQETRPQLIKCLESINDMANELYKMVSGIPCFPPSKEAPEDVLLAAELVQKIEGVLAFLEVSNEQN